MVIGSAPAPEAGDRGVPMVNSRIRDDMITGTVNRRHGTPTIALASMAPDRTGRLSYG